MEYDILEALNQIAAEKNMDMDEVVETLKSSLIAAAKKKYGESENIVVNLDRRSGELNMHALKKVVKEVTDESTEISLEEAKDIDDSAEEGDEMEIYLPLEEFGRNAIANAKQLLIQKVREAERELIYNEYIKKVGELVTGSVQQIDKGDIIVNLGRAEAAIPVKQQISKEKYRQGDRIRALILDVQRQSRGPQVILSRADDAFLRRLFELEVPEIFERIIDIKAIAREPGERAKVAVSSADERIDPVGACVGVKGVRVQAIVRELNNERIDIVPYHPDPEMFVTRALSPAKVVRIDTFPDDSSMTIVVEDEQLSLAIGKGGQNARLAAKLTGWKVNIIPESDFYERKRIEAESKVEISKLPHIGQATVQKLIAADYRFIQDVLEVAPSRLTEIDGIGPKKADTIIDAAREYMFDLEQRRTAEGATAEEKKPRKKKGKKEIKDAADLFVDFEEDDVDDEDEGDEDSDDESEEDEEDFEEEEQEVGD
jgi:N utilization substance protein A